MSDSLTEVTWVDGDIDGCSIRELKTFSDERGWLMEFFRSDELDRALHPSMGYISQTEVGVTRGPHEHEDQTDLFVFFHGTMRLYLWDARKGSPTFGHRKTVDLGQNRPAIVIVPPGIVHGYKNVGPSPALIINCPNRLYAGEDKAGPVDEIRHEDDPDSPFKLD
jgi:dTDP-4-dehydrorhamnose 3,5-epimerase